jgi:hypothetical protein
LVAQSRNEVGSKLAQTARHACERAWNNLVMRRKGLSVRLERHIERGEELMELNRTAFDRNTQAFERMMAVLDRHEQTFEENRIFIRDMNRRNEKVVQDLVRHGGEVSAEHARDTAAIIAQLEDLTEESRAQREGLLAAIDRLPPTQGS